MLGTVGETLLALDAPAAAERSLRKSLQIRESWINRLALARALAVQERWAEAIFEAEQVLHTYQGLWQDDQPNAEDIQGWLTNWRAKAGDANTPTTPSPTEP